MTDRGRVPFAFVGVLLLASSLALAPTLTPGGPTSDPAVDAALDQLGNRAVVAVREGAAAAARRAAWNPVVSRANTSFGRTLNRSGTFRDALRVRVYLAVKDGLEDVSGRIRGHNVTASLPPVDGPAGLRAAKRRVHLQGVGPNDTTLRVTVDGVGLQARRGGHLVANRTVSPSLVVDSPVLAVHDRVARYQRLLDNGPLEPGLGRRLTGLLYPLAWARGFAQYRGGPIQNVVANRHVGVLVNSAVLGLQRRVFGTADPLARQVLAGEFARVGVADVLAAGAQRHPALAKLEALRSDPAARRAVSDVLDAGLGGADRADVPSPSERVSVGVNASADRALLAAVDGLNRTIERTFTATVRLRGRVVHERGGQPSRPRQPGPGWTLRKLTHDRDVTVRDRAASPAPAPGGWHLLSALPRTVETRIAQAAHWEKGGETRVTWRVDRRVANVTVRLEGFHHNGPAPTRPIDGPHATVGESDSGRFAGVADRARERLLDRTVDDVARQLASGGDVGRNASIRVNWSVGVRDTAVRDLTEFRGRLRNLSVTVERGDLATFQTNPAAELADTLRRRRGQLIDAPDSYATVAQRARYAARTRLVNETIDRLEARARSQRGARNDLASAVPGAAVRTLRTGYNRRQARESGQAPASDRLSVDAAPAYLTTSEVTHEEVPAVSEDAPEHPLVLANTNVVSVPYGDAADFLTSLLSGPTRVSFRTAAQVLAGARRLDDQGGVATGSLAAELRESLDGIEAVLASRLVLEGYGPYERARRAVRSGLGRWPTPSSRALAVANGSVAAAVAHAVDGRYTTTGNRTPRGLLAVRLRVTLQRARGGNLTRLHREVANRTWTVASPFVPDVRPVRKPVNETASALREKLTAEVRQRLGDGLRAATKRALENRLERSFAHLPAGLPIAPVPGSWYATVNAWRVRARGEYARFAVRVPHGTPVGSLTYVRDGHLVRFDVDDDGTPEQMGRASRVDFAVETVVGIAVPPGGTGVGDVDGQTNETSPGWDQPGPE